MTKVTALMEMYIYVVIAYTITFDFLSCSIEGHLL